MVQACLKNAKSEYFETCKNGNKRRRVKFECASCKKSFARKGVNVDHIEPVIEIKTGFVSYDVYVDRLFCNSEGLQILCKSCHGEKTKAENKVRRQIKKKTSTKPGRTKK